MLIAMQMMATGAVILIAKVCPNLTSIERPYEFNLYVSFFVIVLQNEISSSVCGIYSDCNVGFADSGESRFGDNDGDEAQDDATGNVF